jgi:O-antigen/teichoic acid export membrane protein
MSVDEVGVDAPAPARSLLGVAVASIPAVLDQVLFASTNFVLSLQLARSVSRTEFGAFTLWLSVLVLLGMVYASVVIGPMLVYATTRYADRLPAYLSGLYRAHLPVVVLPSVGFLALAGGLTAVGQPGAAAYLAGLAAASPGVLLLWLARSACFVRPETRYLAPAGGAVYLVLVLLGAKALGPAALSGPSLFTVMGVAGLVCGAVMLARLKASPWPRPSEVPPVSLPELTAAHRSFGLWLLAVTVVTWVMFNAYPFVIRTTSSLADAGGFQADMNLLAPLFQGTSAICILFMPMLAASRTTPDFRRLVRSLGLLLGLAGGAFWVLVAVFGDQIVRLTYGAAYVERAGVLPLLAGICVLNAVAGVYGAGLRALERPSSLFRAYLVASAVLLVAGLVLIPPGGLVGAAVGSILAWTVALLLLRRSCWLEWAHQRPATAAPRVLAVAADEPIFLQPSRLGPRPARATAPPTRPDPVARPGTPEPASSTIPDQPGGRGRTVGAVLALAPMCLVVLALDRNGLFTRGGAVRNLLPVALLGVVGLAFLVSGQSTVRRPERADKALLVLAAYLSLGFVLHVYSGDNRESDIAITLALLLGATHLVAGGRPSTRQCEAALRHLCSAGVIYAVAFIAANAGLLGAVAPTVFKQMQSGILVVPLVAAVLTRRWWAAVAVGGAYAFGFLNYSEAATNRSAGHGGTYLAVAAVAALVYLAVRGRTRRSRLLRTAAVILLLVGGFLMVRDAAPRSSSIATVTAVAHEGNDSSAFRANVWGAALEEIAHRPLLGGQFSGSIAVHVEGYVETELLVHNDLLQLALDGGLLAAGLYLFIVIDVNRRALRGYQELRRHRLVAHRQLLLTAFIGFDAFVIVGVFNPAIFMASVSSVGFVMYALIRVLERVRPDEPAGTGLLTDQPEARPAAAPSAPAGDPPAHLRRFPVPV